MKSVVINLVLFKAGWIACVFGAAAEMPAISAIAVAAVTAIHLARVPHRRAEIMLLGSAVLMGLVWESILVSNGVLLYGDDSIGAALAPYWIVMMWLLFSTTLNIGMRWLKKSLWIAALAGAVGGPLSFIAGERAGAVSFSDPTFSLVVIGIGWSVLLPLLTQIARYVDALGQTRLQEV